MNNNNSGCLECFLNNCQYNPSVNDKKPCSNLFAHIQTLETKFKLPVSCFHKIQTPIKNQSFENGNYDYCVAIAVADLVHYYNNLDKENAISDLCLWNNRQNLCHNGMFISEAINLAQTIGTTTKKDYDQYCTWLNSVTIEITPNKLESNDGNVTTTVEKDSFKDNSCTIAIPNFDCYYLPKNNFNVVSIIGLKIALTCFGPCLLSLPSYKQYGKFWQKSQNHNVNNVGCNDQNCSSYHSVCLIGYQSNDNLIVRNSWGEKWGKRGYGIINAQELFQTDFTCQSFIADDKLQNYEKI